MCGFFVSAARRSNAATSLVAALLLCAITARGQSVWPNMNLTRSSSGQFTVRADDHFSPLLHNPSLATNATFVRLEPALLAISAEHFKRALWRQLDVAPDAPWRGGILLALHAARTTSDGITITSSPFLQTWSYQVDLPDLLPRTRYARALAGVLLLELANRHAPNGGRSAEIPAWLTDGLAQQILADDGDRVLLSAPAKPVDGLLASRLNKTERGLDPLASARRVLQNADALTFDQLSWPTDAQMNGADGGVYLASAQLFTLRLLGLENGPAKMRALLARLPGCLNWQTAFFAAFHEDFQRPLDVEKWWSLRVVAFAAHAPGPGWTPEISRERLDELLAVPAEFRRDSNALPAHVEISLQDAVRGFDPAQRDAMLQIKLRDLDLALFHLAPPFAALSRDYRVVLADFLGEGNRPAASILNRHEPAGRRASLRETLKRLDALDARRREFEKPPKPILPSR
jgi:hypothetical protein